MRARRSLEGQLLPAAIPASAGVLCEGPAYFILREQLAIVFELGDVASVDIHVHGLDGLPNDELSTKNHHRRSCVGFARTLRPRSLDGRRRLRLEGRAEGR